MAGISTADVRAFIAARLERRRLGRDQPELALLKRMYTLAIQAGKLLTRPHVPLLAENNVRTGFFEREQFDSVIGHLPEPLRPMVTFAYVTGWRIPSEVLTLQWRQVDLEAGTVRLDPGTTKSGEGRVVHLTADLRTLLESQRAITDAYQRERQKICRGCSIGTGSRSEASGSRGRPRADSPDALAAFRMTSDGPPCGTSCGLVSPSTLP